LSTVDYLLPRQYNIRMVNKLFIESLVPADESYRVVRDESRGLKYKKYCEELWVNYSRYADNDFPQQLAQDFDARFWEMYLTCTLIRNSYNVVPKKKNKGPDIQIRFNSIVVWIEAVTPTCGDLTKPDSVPQPKSSIAQRVPDEQMTLRYCSAIRDKYVNYLKYDMVKMDECYIIAINSCKMPWAGDYDPPRIVRSVLPFGWPTVTLDTAARKIINRGNQFRGNIEKTGGKKVATDIFLDTEYGRISAVMSSNVNFCNLTQNMGDDFIIVLNPLALNKLPDDFPKVGVEYQADLVDNKITLSRKILNHYKPRVL
jgi:hypothetical protein